MMRFVQGVRNNLLLFHSGTMSKTLKNDRKKWFFWLEVNKWKADPNAKEELSIEVLVNIRKLRLETTEPHRRFLRISSYNVIS